MAVSESKINSIFDMMCCRIEDWKRFATVLEIERVISKRDLRENERYKEVYDKINKCINEKIQSSEEKLEWDYWRKILLQIDEADLVEDIEEKYPDILLNKNIDISNVVHHMFKEFGILSHDAGRSDNFKKLPVKLKDDIKVCVGGGTCMTYSLKSASTMPTVQDAYFKKFSIFEKIKKFDFSTGGKAEECVIVQTVYAWLDKNHDNGFCIKGYDVNEHLKLISENYINKNPNQSYVLAYSAIHNVIFYIDTNPTSIKISMRKNRSNIRALYSANQCLDGQPFIFIPITVYDPTKLQIDYRTICKTCIQLQLVVSTDIFKDLNSFERWCVKILNETSNMKEELPAKTDISNELLKSIIGFMPLVQFNLPNYTTVPRKEIQEAQKLIMLTPEQQKIVYSKNKRKIIKGAFGSGKTVVAQQLIKHVLRNVHGSEVAYYIFHDSSSAYLQEMKKLAKTFDNNKLRACHVSELVGDNRSLSSILRHLSQNCICKSVHVFIEEFNGEVLDEEEVKMISLLLKSAIFQNAHIVLVCQSMESERYLIQDKDRLLYNKYQFQKLSVQTDFVIFHLSYLLRSSEHINNIVDVAIPILHQVFMESIVPAVPKNNEEELQQTIVKEAKNKKSSTISDADKLLQPASMPNVSHPTSSTAVNPDNKTESKKLSTMKQESEAPSTQIDSTVNLEEYFIKETYSEQKCVQIRDTDKLLKHCTINSNQYKQKLKLVSSFNFVGERISAHTVKGTKPVVYIPFNSESKNYISKGLKKVFKRQNQTYNHQIYCLSKVLQKIDCSNNNDKQTIICMNDDSKRMVQIALAVNKTKWTDNPKLLSTTLTFLTDYASVRGCEFLNVILIYPNDEHHLKHHLVDGISRCIFNLKLIVLNMGIYDKILLAIINEWMNKDFVVIDDENYLKNVSQSQLQEFYQANKKLLVKDDQKQFVNFNDAQLIQKLFERKQFDATTELVTTFESPVPIAVSHDIWNRCKTVERNEDLISVFDALKQNHIDINSIYQFRKYARPVSLLHYAIYQNDLNTVNVLLNMKIDVNLKDNFERTPLHVAVHNNNIKVVRLLLQVDKIKVNRMDNQGWTALQRAAAYNYNDIAKLLLRINRIDVNLTTNHGTALHVATVYENIDIIKVLLKDQKIDINKANYHAGDTPLHEAVYYNSTNIVELLLLEDNIDVNKGNNVNDTPLHVAAFNNNIDILLLLLQHGDVDVNMINNKGCSALHQAASNSSCVDSVKLLLQKDNISVNITDNKGWTPLHVAVKSNSIPNVKLLLEADDIDVDKKDNIVGATPLDIATVSGKHEIIKMLKK